MTVIEAARRQRGMSQKAVAEATGLHPATVSQIERAAVRAYPKARRLLCEFYGLDERVAFDERGLARELELKLA